MLMTDEKKFFTSLEQVFRDNRKTLERLAYYYIGDEEEAKDVVSHCFISLWEHRETIDEDSILQYLFVTMRNKCLDYRRSNTIHKKIYEHLLQTEKSAMEYYTNTIESHNPSTLFSQEILDICNETLQKLPTEARESFIRTRFEGFSYKEVAEALGIPVKKVDKNIQKAMKQLKLALAEYLPIIGVFIGQWLDSN